MVFGGTDTHLTNLDCKTVTGRGGATLSGDMAARILDIAGLVVNRNTIPGDKTSSQASGIRLGSPWVTQRGLKEKDMVAVADIIADVLLACVPYIVETRQGPNLRAKVDFQVLENAKLRVRAIAEKAGIDFTPARHGYPHFFYMDNPVLDGQVTLQLCGANARSYVSYVFSSNVETLAPGQSQKTALATPQETIYGVLTCVDLHTYRFSLPGEKAGLAAAWLRAILSDGYVSFDADVTRRVPDRRRSSMLRLPRFLCKKARKPVDASKPYFIGIEKFPSRRSAARIPLGRERKPPAPHISVQTHQEAESADGSISGGKCRFNIHRL